MKRTATILALLVAAATGCGSTGPAEKEPPDSVELVQRAQARGNDALDRFQDNFEYASMTPACKRIPAMEHDLKVVGNQAQVINRRQAAATRLRANEDVLRWFNGLESVVVQYDQLKEFCDDLNAYGGDELGEEDRYRGNNEFGEGDPTP